MGVLGLTPFLLKSFPEVVKQLPDRLQGLAGKTVVIDGTLITQRLHFSQVPHAYRHMLGWYRLVKEFEASGVSAICVFDGKERSLAKARETERRREIQRLAVARGSIELDRVKRLNRLIDVLDRFQKLDAIQRGRVAELLQLISSGQELPPSAVSPDVLPEGQTPIQDAVAQLQQRAAQLLVEVDHPYEQDRFPISATSPPPTEEEYLKSTLETEAVEAPIFAPGPSKSTVTSDEITLDAEAVEIPVFAPGITSQEAPSSTTISNDNENDPAPDMSVPQPTSQTPPPLTSVSTPITPSDPPPVSTPSVSSAPLTPRSSPPPAPSPANQPLPPLERPFPSPITDALNAEVSPSTEDNTVATVALLYFDFRDSVRKLASLTPVAPDVPGHSTETEEQDARVEYSMTKSQIQLTADEAKLWEELASPAPYSPDSYSPVQTLSALSQRADLISQSYQRRTHPPTTQTYDETKELLRAMGVPCMDTIGTYEAEALASALVLNGFADYVASEDTDVVIYEAPLIRNITSRNGPLMVLSGLEIRTALELDRSSFIDFALLLGTDFSQRIKNVGPSRALKFIRQHKSIERVIEAETKFTPRVPAATYLAEVEVARLVFQTLPPLPDANLLEQAKDEEGLVVLLQRFGLGKLLMADESWDFEEALQGNYFSDDPSA
ncbi:PIN domain-like protein [Mycena rosella]|uniref:PIN domain-like protein n=1 Tax=Mycena rosella TaxID=1033263 RepID=A0AAD7CUG8_MYCRO|nr:PIN domain-like protein [Mycena rosella]